MYPTQQFLDEFKKTQGAISVTEAIAIMNLAANSPTGVFADIGSHAGKSAMSAAAGIRDGALILVDPVFDLNNLEAWSHSHQQHPFNNGWLYTKEEDFIQKVAKRIEIASNNKVIPFFAGDYSENFLSNHSGYGYLFIDSDTHQGGMVLREVKIIEDSMVKGGVVAFHDYGNQFKEPKEAADYLVSTGKYVHIDIDWNSIINYVRENNLEEGNESWHMVGTEFPNFVGAVRRV